MQSLFRISRPVGQLRPRTIRGFLPLGTATRQTSLGPKSIVSHRAKLQVQAYAQSRMFRSSSCFQVDSEDQQPGEIHNSKPAPADARERADTLKSSVHDNPVPTLFDAPADHGISNLKKPWRPCDLQPVERLAYVKYGPNYFEHLSPHERARAEDGRKILDRQAKRFEKSYGPDWYTLIFEAMKLRHESTLHRTGTELREAQEQLKGRVDALKAEGATLSGTATQDQELGRLVEEHQTVKRERDRYWRKGDGALKTYIAKILEKRKDALDGQTDAPRKSASDDNVLVADDSAKIAASSDPTDGGGSWAKQDVGAGRPSSD